MVSIGEMGTSAVFPTAPMRAGMYESFYLRAVSPVEPIGVWIRHTVHKQPGRPPRGSVWCTVFDARWGEPFMHKLTREQLSAPAGSWIAVGEEAEIGPGRALGRCGGARWSLRFASREPELRHLSPRLLYRLPLPRTKLTSPAPAASFDGTLQLEGREAIELRGWPGMVGHNWGSEHAERWIWLHGTRLRGGARSLDRRGARAREPRRAADALGSERGAVAGWAPPSNRRPGRPRTVRRGEPPRMPAAAPRRAATARWRLASRSLGIGRRLALRDPDGGEHDVVNCSVAELELRVAFGDGQPTGRLRTAHGGAYELGMRERDHGVPIAPFADG